jgi:hypothetical protein
MCSHEIVNRPKGITQFRWGPGYAQTAQTHNCPDYVYLVSRVDQHMLLRVQGHAACQQHVLTYGLPTLVVGGGGYKISNTARCWAYETGRIVGMSLHFPKSKLFLVISRKASSMWVWGRLWFIMCLSVSVSVCVV